MSKIRSRNTKIEIGLRKFLWKNGVRGYRIHNKQIPGKPDIYFPKRKIAIFVDGCYWHSCPKCGLEPKSNTSYWTNKLKGNNTRDKRITATLKSSGVRVIRIWEHKIKQNLSSAGNQLLKSI